MIIFFITTQEALCNKMAESLAQRYNHIVRVFTNPRDCYRAAITTGTSRIDLVACDYLVFDMEEINPFKIMSVHNCIIPFFFYNSPFAPRENRVSFWLEKIQKRLKLYLSEKDFSKYEMPAIKASLEQIDGLISSPEINPYVKLICNPPSFPAAELTLFRQRNNIQYSRFKVLSYLFEHKDKEITEEALCMYVWNDFSAQKRRILYSYISELRKICRQDDKIKMAISRPNKQCYCLTVVS